MEYAQPLFYRGTKRYKRRQNFHVTKPSKNPTRKPVPYWTDECTAAVKERNKAKNKMQQT